MLSVRARRQASQVIPFTTLALAVAGAVLASEQDAMGPRKPAVPVERLEVKPDPEDRPAPVKDKWVRFAEALGPGRSAGRSEATGTDASGTRYTCYTPCFINCCVRGPDPSTSALGRNAGR